MKIYFTPREMIINKFNDEIPEDEMNLPCDAILLNGNILFIKEALL